MAGASGKQWRDSQQAKANEVRRVQLYVNGRIYEYVSELTEASMLAPTVSWNAFKCVRLPICTACSAGWRIVDSSLFYYRHA